MIVPKTKEDALRHIDALYPIGQTERSDEWWLEEIEKFGIQNLPEELLVNIAIRQLKEEGEL